MLQPTLSQFKAEFDQFLISFLDDRIASSLKINSVAAQNITLIQELVKNGGKRLRPFLVYLGFGLQKPIDERDKLEIFRVGAALELFHTFALIHDDLIDNSLTRRGLPTIEAKYRKIFAGLNCPSLSIESYKPYNSKVPLTQNLKNVDNLEIANKMAVNATILAGDFAHTLADLLMNQVSCGRVRDLYYQMQFELVAGQLDDCFGVGFDALTDLSQERILNMLRAKSGNYSIQKPLLLGWQLASSGFENRNNSDLPNSNEPTSFDSKFPRSNFNASNLEINTNLEIEKALKQAGEQVGLVFQLTDDILGVFGQTFQMGKSNQSDLAEGKKTLLIWQTWQSSTPENRQFIEKNLGNFNGDFDRLRQIIKESGALAQIQKMCQDLSEQATFQLQQVFVQGNENNLNLSKSNLTIQDEKMKNIYLEILLELIDYLVSREK